MAGGGINKLALIEVIRDQFIHIEKTDKTILFGRTETSPLHWILVASVAYVITAIWQAISGFSLISYQSFLICAVSIYGLIFNFSFLIIMTPKRLKFLDFGFYFPRLTTDVQIELVETKPTSEFEKEKNKIYFYYEKELFESSKSTVAIMHESLFGDGFGTDKNSMKLYSIIEQSVERMKKRKN